MKFYDHCSVISEFLKRNRQNKGNEQLDRAEAYRRATQAVAEKSVKETGALQAMQLFSSLLPQRWEHDKRPFYNLWPAAAEVAAKVPLQKIAAEQLKPLSLSSLLVRFPQQETSFQLGTYRVKTMLCAPYMPDDSPTHSLEKLVERSLVSPYLRATRGGFFVSVQFAGESDSLGIPLGYDHLIPLIPGKLVSECVVPLNNSHIHPDTFELTLRCLRLYCFLCLLDGQSDLLERVVLSADRQKYEEKPDEKLVEKAIRRGVNGWDVGRSLETVPHFRRPHFAIRWMGHGEPKQAVLRPVKGSVVHRDKLKEIPTGYLDDIEVASDDPR